MSVLRSRWPVLVLSLACAVLLYALYAPGYWVFDDWLYFSLARQFGPFSETWLNSVYFQHWAPLHRMGMAVATDTGASFDLVLAVTIAALAATGPLLVGILDALWGRHRIHLLAAGFYLLSVFFVSPLNWWSAGLQMIPTAFGGALAVWAYLRWRADRRDRWLVLVALGIGVGLLFYIRPLLVPVYAALIRFLLLEARPTPRRIWEVVKEERRAVVALLAPCVVYGVHYLALGTGNDAQGQYTAPSDYAEFFGIAWARVLVPGLLGFRVQPADVGNHLQAVVVVVGEVLLIGFAALTVLRRRSAWRGWALFVGAAFVNLLIIAIPRVPPFGPGIAYSPRYFTDVALLFPVAVATAWRGAPAVAATERVRGITIRRTPLYAGATLLVVVYALISIGTTRTQNDEWFGKANRLWVENLERTQRQLATAQPPVVVANHQTPDYVVYKDYPPYDRLSVFTRTVGLTTQVDGALDGRQLMNVGPDGTATPATFAPESGGDVAALVRQGVVRFSSGTVTRRAGATCLAAGPTQPAFVRFLPGKLLTAPKDHPELYVRAGARVASPTELTLRSATRPLDYPVGSDLTMPLTPGATQFLGWLHTDRAADVRLDVPAGAEACFSSLEVGTVDPQQPGA